MFELILAFSGSLCAGIIFNIRRDNLIWSGISGLLGWLAYVWMNSVSGSIVLSTFAGAIAVGVFSETAARAFKAPSTIYSVTGIFPIVPGIAAYEAVRHITENNLQAAALKAIETAGCAGSIAFGILCVTSAFKLAAGIINGRKATGE